MVYVSASTGLPIKAVLFDTFGTVVDWRTGVVREFAGFAWRHQLNQLDATAFADAWRAKYEPSMEPIRNGSRGFVPLDQLHRESLLATLSEFGLDPADYGDELDHLSAAWERLDPWDDCVPGLAAPGSGRRSSRVRPSTGGARRWTGSPRATGTWSAPASSTSPTASRSRGSTSVRAWIWDWTGMSRWWSAVPG